MKKVILTGDRPTGPLHLGHYIGSLQNRIKLQHTHKQFLIIADLQALTDHAAHPGMIKQNILEVCLDYLAVGLNPNLNTIFVQSQIPELTELTNYFLNLVTIARLERNPTVKTEIQQKRYERDIPAGFLIYPISQAADITAFKTDTLPIGEDQNAMIEQTNEIVRKFNRIYNTQILKTVEPIIGKIGRLPGIDGKAKMSKSLHNTIDLSESSASLKKKVNAMFTDPGHLRIEDPGKIDGNTVFTYLDAFAKDAAKIELLKQKYVQGGLGDGVIKSQLFEVLEELIAPIRDKRAEFAKDPGEVINILTQGSEKAREVVASTLSEVRNAIGILSL